MKVGYVHSEVFWVSHMTDATHKSPHDWCLSLLLGSQCDRHGAVTIYSKCYGTRYAQTVILIT